MLIFRACREDYDDDAVEYVPEKYARSIEFPRNAIVSVWSVDTAIETVSSVTCEDRPASQGGCKHGVAFLMWVHRRREEPSPTLVECYWNKSVLSSVGSSIKFVYATELGNKPNPPTEVPELFLQFFSKTKDSDFCCLVVKNTVLQSKSSSCHELQYGRITASKLYEVVHCSSFDGSLVEKILGVKNITTTAMKRVSALEPIVLLELRKLFRGKGTQQDCICHPHFQ
ncbi:hypothetical protein PR048_019426 [Dryococelus australis]|uniref:Uncharacterized protein n=1 Tax=Dryococelus australis TaxID=614101 RepID=A0ABQ9H3G9_9NEOP|nr:hypothetical protein PR048_019426 [Dryococelus australis]